MYDLSGPPAGGLQGSSEDWTHLATQKHHRTTRLPETLGKTRRRCLGCRFHDQQQATEYTLAECP